MKVIYCGQIDYWKNAPDHLGIKQGMQELGWDWHIVDPCIAGSTPDGVVAEINDLNPDLVIHGNTDSFGQHLFERIRSDTCQIFNMYDYRTPEMLHQGEWDDWVQSAPYISAATVSAKAHIPMWEHAFGVPVFFLPHACWVPPKLEYDPEFDFDVLFTGGHHSAGPLAARAELIMDIQYLLIDQSIKLTQVNETDWEKRNQVWTDLPKYYHSSKIVLDVSHFWHNPGYCSGRYWYTATLGGCAVTKRFVGCEEFFPHTYKWYFDTPTEAVGLIKNLLKQDDLRESTKEAVAKYAWEHHTYAQRFTQMLEGLEKAGVKIGNQG